MHYFFLFWMAFTKTTCIGSLHLVIISLTAFSGNTIILLFYYAYLNEFFNEKFYLWPSFYVLHLAWKGSVAAKKSPCFYAVVCTKKWNHFQNSNLSFVQLPDHYYWTIISYLKPIYRLEKYKRKFFLKIFPHIALLAMNLPIVHCVLNAILSFEVSFLRFFKAFWFLHNIFFPIGLLFIRIIPC